MEKTEKLVINGPAKLSGSIRINGAKNAALKVMAASLLTDKEWHLKNVPEIEDILRIGELIESVGGKISKPKKGEYKIRVEKIKNCEIKEEIAKRLRASIIMVAPLLARCGKARFPHPGGCVIGKRPIDIFLDGFERFGAKIKVVKGCYEITAKKLKATDMFFRVVSVTGTETMILLAVMAKGKTILRNAACEPEIVSLADFLNKCGAKIKGAGTPFVEIEGVEHLSGGEYVTIPDRIEAGSFAIMAACTNSEVKLTNCEPNHLDSLLAAFDQCRVPYEKGRDWLTIKKRKKALEPFNLLTHEYPGFPTDLQAPFVVFLTQTKGRSLVHEIIFEGRLFWTTELIRMGADISLLDPHRIMVFGPTELRGREIESLDIRSGIAFIIAGLTAKGQTIIDNVYQIDRGYEKIEERLRKLGADIKRIN